jgi:hypothetical protein
MQLSLFEEPKAETHKEKTDYFKRLKISLTGDSETEFTTNSGTKIAKGYERIVIGGRGPYIEFSKNQMLMESINIPEAEEKRLNDTNKIYYYWEYRSNDDSNVKVYYQKKTVDYADYKVQMFYVSPFDVLADGKVIIEKLRK